ncbi:MAG: AAA family ATPase [Dehalococcoidia bacterium]|jgi:predicted ATPase
MKLIIKNLGPINQSEIDIRHFNIVIGRNNSGKSHLAKAIFAVISTISSPPETKEIGRIYDISMLELNDTLYTDKLLGDKKFSKLQSNLMTVNYDVSDLLVGIVNNLVDILNEHLTVIFATILNKTFSCSVDELIRLGKDTAEIQLRLSPSVSFLFSLNRKSRIQAAIKYDQGKLLRALLGNESVMFSLKNMRGKSSSVKVRRATHLNKIVAEIRHALFRPYNTNCPYYMPAGRSGLIDSWQTIASAWGQLAAVSISKGLRMPPLPGTAALFLDNIRSLSNRRNGIFGDFRNSFIKILGGDIEVTSDRTTGVKDFFYCFEHCQIKHKIPIMSAGSMVKEIGPLYLFATEMLAKGDLFIVEEPESHLHPAAQSEFAKLSVSMASEGACFLFTTHSDLFLRSVAHAIYTNMSNKANKNLTPTNLGIYLLSDGPDGSCTKPIIIEDYGSIEELSTFDEVYNELYDREMKSRLS